MTHAHNFLIRGLNSIYQQAPYLTPTSGASEKDITDFLFFTHAWTETIIHHHDAEESSIFPLFAAFTGEKDIMAANVAQHELFHDGLHKLGEYATGTSAKEYDPAKLRSIIDGFGPVLVEHLKDEIVTLLKLDTYDSDGLMVAWREGEEVAKVKSIVYLECSSAH